MPQNNEPATPQTSNVSERPNMFCMNLLLITQPIQTSDDARAELTVQLEDLLNTLSNKFAGVSSEIFAKSTCMVYPIILGYTG